jgi:hypothetical protein
MSLIMQYVMCTVIIHGIYTGIVGAIGGIVIMSGQMVGANLIPCNNELKEIEKMDIEHKLKLHMSILRKVIEQHKLIEKEISDLTKTQIFDIIKHKPDNINDPIQICVNDMCKLIESIYIILRQIEKKMNLHKNKWFNGWRHINLTNNVNELKSKMDKLDVQFKDMMAISLFLSNL